MDIFRFLVDAGYGIFMAMTQLYELLTSSLVDLLPEGAGDLIGKLPVVGTILSTPLLELMFGAGIILVVGYTIVKWLIP